ncbi:hypothetical protein BKA81DRAFT_80548 [Phyllosticta paracitricarpa]|uniref:Secreted protein n=1 Tax=Phyllosticta paracitricarpa TaxID=2016321 RepID=A0ABR1N6U0_9PEZI
MSALAVWLLIKISSCRCAVCGEQGKAKRRQSSNTRCVYSAPMLPIPRAVRKAPYLTITYLCCCCYCVSRHLTLAVQRPVYLLLRLSMHALVCLYFSLQTCSHPCKTYADDSKTQRSKRQRSRRADGSWTGQFRRRDLFSFAPT